jgi:hypothetical protein
LARLGGPVEEDIQSKNSVLHSHKANLVGMYSYARGEKQKSKNVPPLFMDGRARGEKCESEGVAYPVCHFEGVKRLRNPAVDSGKKDASDHHEAAFHNLKEKESHIQEANLRTRRAPSI